MAHPVIHWEIGGRDTERLREFYTDLFGWEIDRRDPEYSLISTGEGVGGAIMRTREDMPAHVTIYVRVQDLDQALRRAAALGGKQLVGPTPIPGVGGFALFADPEGNAIGLLAPAFEPGAEPG
jgi:predicted enzyme related to lactoylglutathione lyase